MIEVLGGVRLPAIQVYLGEDKPLGRLTHYNVIWERWPSFSKQGLQFLLYIKLLFLRGACSWSGSRFYNLLVAFGFSGSPQAGSPQATTWPAIVAPIVVLCPLDHGFVASQLPRT